MMRRLEEEKKEAVPFIYAPRVKEKKENSFVDGLLTVIDIIIFTALIASYLIVFDMSGSFSIKEITFIHCGSRRARYPWEC